MSPRVSVVIPVHGRARLTARCLDALLAQRLADCELIVVDDASPDSTAALLAAYGQRVRVRTLPENRGYAGACNAGAAIAQGEQLVFLNNDTEPRAGWLERLREHARAHPAAAIVGAKLLYPNGTVQHAGVVIGQDGYPHNLYAGLPAEHPAVNRSRRLQAVTGACMFVRRGAFERAGGFDARYLNSLEDVDLCLRVGEAGGEVRYCHEAVVTHLESASRGRAQRFERSVRLWRERWRERARRDDLEVYARDGLLDVEYGDAYPLRLGVSPRLASVDTGRHSEIENLLETYAGQVSDLLAEVLRLTVGASGATDASARAGANGSAAASTHASEVAAEGSLDHRAFLAEAGSLEEGVRGLQHRLQEGSAAFAASEKLGYRSFVQRVRAAVEEAVPEGASVLVVSRGDRELVKLGARDASHFPQDQTGGYLGHHPLDSDEAIARLEQLRHDGAEYLVLPATSHWWLEHYGGLAAHLRERCAGSEHGVCRIYRLVAERAPVRRKRATVREERAPARRKVQA